MHAVPLGYAHHDDRLPHHLQYPAPLDSHRHVQQHLHTYIEVIRSSVEVPSLLHRSQVRIETDVTSATDRPLARVSAD